jgi:SAM-dependent methyltransferase
MFDRQVQAMFYRKAKAPEDLPWHRDEPGRFLAEATEGRAEPGLVKNALDLGCGSGVFSVYMAKRGYEVTGIDLMPRAIEMAKERADREEARVTWVNADLLEWRTPLRFDLILDSGCLHSLIGGDRRRYRAQILAWLAPGGDYILGHFGKRGFLDWRPVGPARRTRREIVDFFSPELVEHKYEQELMTEIALPIGPTVQGQGFWFRRS